MTLPGNGERWRWPFGKRRRHVSGIVDCDRLAAGGECLREVAALLQQRGYRGYECYREALAKAFVIGEEERLVLDDGTTEVGRRTGGA